MLQLSVTTLFYLEDSRKIHLRGVRACRSKDRGEQRPSAWERERAGFGSSISMFISPWACPMEIGQPGVSFVLPEVLTPVLGPSFVLFSQAFPFLVF